MSHQKKAIVTGAEQDIAGLVQGFLKDSCDVKAISLNATRSLTASFRLTPVDDNIRNQETARRASTPQSHTSNPSPYTAMKGCNARQCEALL